MDFTVIALFLASVLGGSLIKSISGCLLYTSKQPSNITAASATNNNLLAFAFIIEYPSHMMCYGPIIHYCISEVKRLFTIFCRFCPAAS